LHPVHGSGPSSPSKHYRKTRKERFAFFPHLCYDNKACKKLHAGSPRRKGRENAFAGEALVPPFGLLKGAKMARLERGVRLRSQRFQRRICLPAVCAGMKRRQPGKLSLVPPANAPDRQTVA
jgi:hypothetical protein